MSYTPGNNEVPQLPPAPAETMQPPAPIEENVEGQMSRRSALRLFGRAIAVTGVAVVTNELVASEKATAEPDTAQPSEEPIPGDTNGDSQLSPEEREYLKARTKNLNADTELKEEQIEELKKGPNPVPLYEQVGKVATYIVTGVGVLGGLGGGWTLIHRHFKAKKEQREGEAAARQLEEKAQRLREDEDYAATVKLIGDKLESLATLDIDLRTNKKFPNYEPLVITYSQLRRFAENPRFTEQVFNLTVSLLQGRAKTILEMHPDQIEARLNADRQVMYFFAMAHSKLPRQDAEGNPILPDARGVSFDGLRYHRRPLEQLNLEGTWIRNQIITGSLAGSRLKQVHFEGSTFGELHGDTARGGACDLRGTDLSRADLHGARFEHIFIDEHTKFGEGLDGDPRATFGKVISDTLEQDQIDEKIAAAQAVIDKWQQDHPEEVKTAAAQVVEVQQQPSRMKKLLSAMGVKQR